MASLRFLSRAIPSMRRRADAGARVSRPERWFGAGAAVLLGWCIATDSAAQGRAGESGEVEERGGWREIEAPLPPYPREHDLLPVDVGSATAHRFFVDARSVSLGADGVMRYTIVIRTEGGATNVAFEGMRCATRERKVYALGRNDGTWVPARDPGWQRIVTSRWISSGSST
jgi:hypothetical protein